MGLWDYYEDLKKNSNERYDNFEIEKLGERSLKYISEEAYLEKPTWLGGDNKYVCLFIDLDNSSKLSFKKHPATMAKIYDYFTQNIVDIMNEEEIKADYIDIKGDGAFGIFEGDRAVFKALCCAVTFKTFFDEHIRNKFQNDNQTINCKLAIDVDKILVKKLGKKGDRNNNEVWAGRVVNGTVKLSSLSRKIYEEHSVLDSSKRSLLIISDKIYKKLESKKDYAITSCGCDGKGNETQKSNIWSVFDCENNDEVSFKKVYYTSSQWCEIHGEDYFENILL